MRALGIIENVLLAQRGHLIGWAPVGLGCGIALYFSLQTEPAWPIIAAMMLCIALMWAASRLLPAAFAPILLLFALILSGVAVAKWQTASVNAPILGFRYYGPIEGRVIAADRSASDATRLTLDHVVLARMSPHRTPDRVRISLHGNIANWQPGDTVVTTGHLSPPNGPAEPKGFDFRRHAYFQGIGAVGYTRNPVLRITAAHDVGWRGRLFAVRHWLSQYVTDEISGDSGAFAAAIITGDRASMPQTVLQNLRNTNLAHLLAISGLHMGLLTGFVFAAVRMALALIPRVALYHPTKKYAAVVALIVGAGYLGLSGGNVATERAYIMVAVMFIAIILDRQALTLRAVAIAATLVLVLHPEALLGPGFQMSFSATTALVVVFRWFGKQDLRGLPKWSKPVLSVVLSSFIAGVATAPFAAAHFNQMAHYGLIANVLSVPIMGAIVMPAAVVAACLAPFGLAWVGFWVMDWGLRWILFVASEVAAIDGGVGYIAAPDTWVLGVMTLGLLTWVLWQGRTRHFGGIITIAALITWQLQSRPALLISASGGLVGIMSPEGRSLTRAKGDAFTAGIWLENDGRPSSQEQAAARSGIARDGNVHRINFGGITLVHAAGKRALAQIADCNGADILVTNVSDDTARSCTVYDPIRLRETGSIALEADESGNVTRTTATDTTGIRPWTTSSKR